MSEGNSASGQQPAFGFGFSEIEETVNALGGAQEFIPGGSVLDAFMTAADPRNFDPNANIWIAASDGDIRRVRQLLAEGKVTPNSADNNGYTPMHAAASYGHVELLNYLIEQKGDVNIRDSDGDTPLHVCETVEVARVLLEHNADLFARNDEGHTPLQKVLLAEREEGMQNEALKRFLLTEGLKRSTGIVATPRAAHADAQQPVKKKKKKKKHGAEVAGNGADPATDANRIVTDTEGRGHSQASAGTDSGSAPATAASAQSQPEATTGTSVTTKNDSEREQSAEASSSNGAV